MKHSFTLPQFPSAVLEIETSIWTGRTKLFKDGVELVRSLTGNRKIHFDLFGRFASKNRN